MEQTADKSNELGTGRLSKLIARFAIPSVIGMMISALYNVVDRIFVGNIPEVGADAFAGISVTFSLSLLVIAFAGLFKLGSGSLAAISLGEGDKEKANKCVNQCFSMCALISVVFAAVILLFTDPIMRLLGASDITLPYARGYIRIIAYGSLFNFLGFGMNNFLYTDGSPKMAMGSMLIGGIGNMILDPIFIFTLKMGANGAAIATVISQFLSFCWTIGYFFLKRCSFKLRLKEMIPDFQLLKRIAILGMPIFINQIAHSVYMGVLYNRTAYYGSDMAVTSMGIVIIISQFTMLPVVGISHGLQPIWGYNYGSKNTKRVVAAYYAGVVLGTVYIAVLYGIYMLFPKVIAPLFISSTSNLNIDFTVKAIRTFLLLEPFLGFEIMTANFYPSVKMPFKSLLLNVFRQVFALIPLICILPMFFGLSGILYAGPISELLTVIISIPIVIYDIKRLKSGEVYNRKTV
ncbi:MAG: MATE family efflux transporter [Clostridia bacterium]|nr:MATE family efflux transporter [Clostridia bacterium]